MKVTNINFENKTFETEDGELYPLMFDINETISLDEFQLLIDNSENIIHTLING